MSSRVNPGQERANGYSTDAGGEEHLLQSRTSSTLRMDDSGLGGMSKYDTHDTQLRVPALNSRGLHAHWHSSGATGSKEVSAMYIGR